MSTPKRERQTYCHNCGEDLGFMEVWPGDIPSCGKRECEREARDIYAQERAEAHEQLDRDMGWS